MNKIRTHKSKIIWIFCGILFLVIINGNSSLLTNENVYNNNETNLKNAGSWELSPFIIDDSGGGDYTWAEAVMEEWCSGDGTWSNPYIIENIIIDGGYLDNCIEIRNSEVYFRVKNCTFFNSGFDKAGIKLVDVNNGALINNNCSYNPNDGISLYLCNYNTISGNIVINNENDGINLYLCNYNTISGNIVINNENGIYILGGCNYNTISGNILNINADKGIRFYWGTNNNNYNTISGNIANNCIYIYDNFNYNLILNNNVSYIDIICSGNNNNIISGNSVSRINIDSYSYNNTISANTVNGGGISLGEGCDDNTISANTVNGGGVSLGGDCDDNIISENILKNNVDGIKLNIDCDNNVISENNLSNNVNGIYFSQQCTLNTIIANIVKNCSNYGVLALENSVSNIISENYFSENNIHANDDGINNQWDNGTIGNFWNDYDGEDANDDGIGDSFYNILGSAGSQDNFPIWRDSDDVAPQITINSPNPNDFTGKKSPKFNIKITDQTLNSTWYRLWNGTILTTNTSFEYLFDTEIDQNIWNEVGNGTVTITFFTNDSIGRLTHKNITVRKDIYNPIITINKPIENELFGIKAPNTDDFIIIFDDPSNIDTIWYMLSNATDNTDNQTWNGYIDQEVWEEMGNGSVIIRFYANDSVGNIGFAEVTIRKDVTAPTININSPTLYELFGTTAPSFNAEIYDVNLDVMWYTLNNGLTNTTFTTNGTIIQALWSALPNGTVTVRFYANDSVGNIGFAEVTIRKDVNAPIITINNPQNSDVIGANAPNFDISIDELNLDKSWYSLNGGNNITFVGFTGTINQALWDALLEGNVIIRFYANDSAGNIGFAEVTIRKDVTAPTININSPIPNELFGTPAPSFNIEIYDTNLDTMWYTLDNGATNVTFTANETIDQSVWDTIDDGIIILTFYVNDTAGNIIYKSVNVIKDTALPVITIISPSDDELFGTTVPSFNVEISDANLNKMWYTIDDGIIKYFFLTNNSLNVVAWSSLSDGVVTIQFYANDTAGNIGFTELSIRKDVTAPIITINNPQNNAVIGATAPNFEISIDELNLDKTWYSLNGGNNITFTGLTGTINQALWDVLPEGNVIITFYANDSAGNIGFVEEIIIKDVTAPTININSPTPNELFGTTAPHFNVDIYDVNLDSMWYTLDNGLTNTTFTTNETISQVLWDALSNGTATITFYANDSAGNGAFSSITVRVDKNAPTIFINSPALNELFGTSAPSFNIEIYEANLDSMWYTLNNGLTNTTFTTNGTIIQALWSALPDGNVIISFYANDSTGNIGFAEVTFRKDVTAPIITINNPQNSDVIGATAPNFDISIDELNLDKTWYSLNGGNNITFIGLTGTINQALWDALPEGNVIIRFYANDTLGRIEFQEITVVKTISQPSPPGIPGYNLLLLLGIVSTVAVIIIKKRLNHLN